MNNSDDISFLRVFLVSMAGIVLLFFTKIYRTLRPLIGKAPTTQQKLMRSVLISMDNPDKIFFKKD